MPNVSAKDHTVQQGTIRAIAFHVPQFHPIPENDSWWGKGFTEWINVVRATPRRPGHYQPHLPADLGFYDLRLPETRAAQAELAEQYGIYGFCYYRYWFDGHQVLEHSVNDILTSGEPDFPFCLCWANEPWARRWDGSNNEMLLEQRHSPSDDLAHIRALSPFFSTAVTFASWTAPFSPSIERPSYPTREGLPTFGGAKWSAPGLKACSSSESKVTTNLGIPATLVLTLLWNLSRAGPRWGVSRFFAGSGGIATRSERVNRFSATMLFMSTKISSGGPWLNHFLHIPTYAAFALAGTIARGEKSVQSSYEVNTGTFRAVPTRNRGPAYCSHGGR